MFRSMPRNFRKLSNCLLTPHNDDDRWTQEGDMSSVPMRYALCFALSALAIVGLILSVKPTTAIEIRGAPLFRVSGEIASAGIESLDDWIDSVRRQHNIPAMGAIVFRADRVLARGIAGLRRSNSTTAVEER